MESGGARRLMCRGGTVNVNPRTELALLEIVIFMFFFYFFSEVLACLNLDMQFLLVAFYHFIYGWQRDMFIGHKTFQ